MKSLTSAQVHDLLMAGGGSAPVYLVGAGGCGMSGLGHLLLDLGHAVAGSDLVVNEEVNQLRARGARIQAGHKAAQLTAAKPCLVVYSSAIRRDNPELQAALAMDIPVVRRAVLLAALLHRQRGIAVAGMHGKTTTSAMLAYALEKLGARPSYAIGARVPQFRFHARYSAPAPPGAPLPPFVIEADESDGTLREFHPEQAVLLNIDEEHLDFYANLEAICEAFGQFARQTRGTVVFCADDPRLAELLTDHPRAVSFGFHAGAEYRLVPQPVFGPERPNRSSDSAVTATGFEVWHGSGKLGDFTIALFGQKNVSNAGAVIACLHQAGWEAGAIARAISGFTGAARRQQELFHDARFRVFDDYGHHPAEIEATLRAFKARAPGRLLVAFQPHRFTRTQLLLPQFARCFGAADALWVGEVYAASESAIPGVNGAGLAAAIRATGQSAQFVPALEELWHQVRAAMQPGDWVLFLGAGDITQAAHQLASELSGEG